MAVEKRDSEVSLSAEGIRSMVSDFEIFRYYCSPFKSIGKKFSSELRNDPNPSAMISFVKDKLKYIDFGYFEHRFDSIDYVQYKYGLRFTDALRMISNDFDLGIASGDLIHIPKRALLSKSTAIQVPKKETVIQISSRQFNSKDRIFWSQFGISLETIHDFDVKAIDYYWIDGRRFTADKLAYAYCEHKKRIKIYQPNSDRKWFSNIQTQDIQGIYNVPIFGPRVLLTSSLKDVMALAEMKIPAVALHSEMLMPHPKLIELLKRKFDSVEVLYDNDFDKPENPGQRMAQRICKEYSLKNILIPSELKSKDISDVVKNHGKETAFNIVKQ